MSRPMPLGPLDEPRDYSGDRGWRGVNMRLEPAALEPGYCSEAINMRFRDGIAETRLGSVVVPWLNRLQPNCVVITGDLPDGAVGEAYSASVTIESDLPHATFTAIGTIPPGLTLSADGRFSGTPTEAGTFTFVVRAEPTA